jgi:hypothetical protein
VFELLRHDLIYLQVQRKKNQLNTE